MTGIASPPKKRRIEKAPSTNESLHSKKSSNIRVVTRVRPLNSKETKEQSKVALVVSSDEKQIFLDNTNKSSNSGKTFEYDTVLTMKSSQKEVYEKVVGKDTIDGQVMKGYNVTILAYGQTGSGKTFTMGTDGGMNDIKTNVSEEYNDKENDLNEFIPPRESDGIIPRAVYDLFTCVRKHNDALDVSSHDNEEDNGNEMQITVQLSYLEIYNEECRDLLSEMSSSNDLSIRETAEGVVVSGLSEVNVNTPDDVSRIMHQAAARRATGSTNMNAVSSRSHAICTLKVKIPSGSDALASSDNSFDSSSTTGSNGMLTSKLTLVDLAGSERLKRTGAEGARMKEGININKGLFVLGQVVSTLSEKGSAPNRSSASHSSHLHVPYRDSKLTRLLQDSLGGNSCTVMVACVSPAEINLDETVNTLRYAQRARSIKNSAIKNVVSTALSSAEVAALLRENKILKLQLIQAQATLSEYSRKNFDQTQYSHERNEVQSNTVNCYDGHNDIGSNKALPTVVNLQMKCTELRARLNAAEQQVQEATNSALKASTQIDKWRVNYEQVLAVAKKCGLTLPEDHKVCKDESLVVKQRNELEDLKSQLLQARIDANVARATAAAIVKSDGNLTQAEESLVLQDRDDISVDSKSAPTSSDRVQKMTGDFLAMSESIEMKEVVAQNMMAEGQCFDTTIREQFEVTIQNLSNDVKSLSKERDDLIAAVKVKENSNENTKLLKSMRERVECLEKKIRGLRSKSAEHSKALKQREIIEMKCKQLKEEILEDKKHRLSLQKKLKEETVERKHERNAARKEANKLMRDREKLKIEIAKVRDTAAKQTAVLRRKAADAAAKLKKEEERKHRQRNVFSAKAYSIPAISSPRQNNLIQWLDRELDLGEVVHSTKQKIEEEEQLLSIANDKKDNLLEERENGKHVNREIQNLNEEISVRLNALNHLKRGLSEISKSDDCNSSFIECNTWNNLNRNELRFVVTHLFENALLDKLEIQKVKSKVNERLSSAVDKALLAEKRSFDDKIMKLKVDHSEATVNLMMTTKETIEKKIDSELFKSIENGIDPMVKNDIDEMLESYMNGCNKIGKCIKDELQEVKDVQNGVKRLYDQLAQGVCLKPKQNKRKKRISEEYELEEPPEEDSPEIFDSDDSDWSPDSPKISKKDKKKKEPTSSSLAENSNSLKRIEVDKTSPQLEEDLQKLKVVDLRALLREKGLKVSGTKKELLKRLLENSKQHSPTNNSLKIKNDTPLLQDTNKDTSLKNQSSETRKRLSLSNRAPLIQLNPNGSSCNTIKKYLTKKPKNPTPSKMTSGRKRRRNMTAIVSQQLAEIENSLGF